MSGSEVKNLQNDLKGLGYFNASSTGYYGSVTTQSVIQYQKSKGLAADGITGHLTARAIKTDKIINTAYGYMGVPYVWGGTSPSGFDCSGFVQYTFLQNGVTIPRTTEDQYKAGYWVNKSDLRPGDLVFFTTYRPGPSHVGIYLGNGKFINASSGAEKIIVTELSNPYFAQRYIGARRVIY
jgi:cell wall-associated NlpC family hydrolase